MATMQEQRDASLEAAIHEAEKVIALRARNKKLESVAQVAQKAMDLIDAQTRALKAMGMLLGARPEWEGEMRAALAALEEQAEQETAARPRP